MRHRRPGVQNFSFKYFVDEQAPVSCPTSPRPSFAIANWGVLPSARLLFRSDLPFTDPAYAIQVPLTQAAPNAPTLMGAMNLAALNVADAIGAWAGSQAIAQGHGLLSAAWAGFGLTLAGLLFLWVMRESQRAGPGAGPRVALGCSSRKPVPAGVSACDQDRRPLTGSSRSSG